MQMFFRTEELANLDAPTDPSSSSSSPVAVVVGLAVLAFLFGPRIGIVYLTGKYLEGR